MIKKINLLIIIFSLISCNKEIVPESPEQIFEKYKGSVVLIASQYYYKIYSDNSVYYYSPGSENKIFYKEEDVLNNLSFSTGTGFIISQNGEIITNNHVVNNEDESFKLELQNHFESVKNSLLSYISAYNDSIEKLRTDYYQYSDQMSYFEKQDMESNYDTVLDRKNILIKLYDELGNISYKNSTSKLVIHKLGIAFNESHVTEFDDLQECVIVKTSENEKIDLALIQTKNQTFNIKPNHIFNFKDNNPNVNIDSEKFKERDIKKPIKINEDVYMIGFNRGFSLANTKQGIKSQFTSGKISQENDGERMLYTIPTLEGSSGSPIVDKWGNLVAVNFAKVTNSQGFSFGIPVYEVKKFIEN